MLSNCHFGCILDLNHFGTNTFVEYTRNLIWKREDGEGGGWEGMKGINNEDSGNENV